MVYSVADDFFQQLVREFSGTCDTIVFLSFEMKQMNSFALWYGFNGIFIREWWKCRP